MNLTWTIAGQEKGRTYLWRCVERPIIRVALARYDAGRLPFSILGIGQLEGYGFPSLDAAKHAVVAYCRALETAA